MGREVVGLRVDLDPVRSGPPFGVAGLLRARGRAPPGKKAQATHPFADVGLASDIVDGPRPYLTDLSSPKVSHWWPARLDFVFVALHTAKSPKKESRPPDLNRGPDDVSGHRRIGGNRLQSPALTRLS